MYRAASVKNNEKFSRFYFKLSQYVIYSVQNNTAINIATAVKWMAINEECLIWGILAAHKHTNILLFSNLCFIHN